VAPVRTNLGSLVDDFEKQGQQIAVVFRRGLRQRRVRYQELAVLSRRFAAELEARGIHKGQRILLWGENAAEWIAAFFGCVLCGVLPVAVDPASTDDFIRRLEREVAPRLIVGDAEKLRSLGSNSPLLFLQSFEQEITRNVSGGCTDLLESDPLQIVFTSGTTGEPKGVVHTHGNVLASLRPIEAEMQKYLKYERVVHPVRILHTLPLSHVFGQFMGLWLPPLFAAEVHYESRLVAAEITQRIRKERISVLAAVPRVLDLLERHVRDRIPNLDRRLEAASGWKAWRRWWHFRDVHRLFGFKFWAFVCGGAALAPEAEQFWGRLGLIVIQGYGMTETTALVSLNHPFRAVRGTIGQVLPGREVKLGSDGEILVRGPTISNTSWQGGKLTENETDWLATGDLAEFDEQGNLHYRGRKKDVIVTSAGLNIHPEDIEAALNRQPGVRTSAVVEAGSNHGPEPFAVIIVKPGTPGDDAIARAAITKANRELAGFQHVTRWMLWPDPDLPRTSTGKVLRREISRRVQSGEFDRAAGQVADLGHESLGLDSLGRVELQTRLEEQYGVTLPETAMQELHTQADVKRLVSAAQSSPGAVAVASGRHWYPLWPWSAGMQAVRTMFLEFIAMPLVRFLAKPAVRVETETWPVTPVLIVANHVTAYDAALVLYALPRQMRRRLAAAMGGEMLLDYRNGRNQGAWYLNLLAPFAYWSVTALFNVFPLPQRSGFRESFAHAGQAIDKGYSVLVFPEGRRSKDGSPQPFKSGTGLLWKELGVPALPVRLEGLGELKTSGRWFRSGRISVRVGPLLPLDPSASVEALTKRLQSNIFP